MSHELQFHFAPLSDLTSKMSLGLRKASAKRLQHIDATYHDIVGRNMLVRLATLLRMLRNAIIIIIINIYIAQIPCEYDQMRVTSKYDTN